MPVSWHSVHVYYHDPDKDALLLDSPLLRGKRFFRLAFFAPYAVPGVIAAIMWGYLYAPDLSPFSAYRIVAGAPLKEVLKLIASAAFFVGNDSGPAHIAAAFGVPTIAIFGASDPAIWGPWRTAGEALSAPDGIENVKADRVMDAIQRLRVNA